MKPLGRFQFSAILQRQRLSAGGLTRTTGSGVSRSVLCSLWNPLTQTRFPAWFPFAAALLPHLESLPAVFTEVEMRRSLLCAAGGVSERPPTSPLKRGSEEGLKVSLVVLAVFSSRFGSRVFTLIGVFFFFFPPPGTNAQILQISFP